MPRTGHIKSKVFAGSILVGLSGYVPHPPYYNSVRAAASTITMTGSFITGVKLAPGINVQLGAIAVSDINGSVIISPAGVVSPAKGVTAGGGQQAGSFLFTAASTGPNIDVTAKGLGPVTLTPNKTGDGPVGTVKINKIIIDNVGPVPLNLTDGGAGTAKVANYDISKKTAPMKVGIQLTWGAVMPLGAFSEQIVLTATF